MEMKILWLLLSGFGIMYAILSWTEEFGIAIPNKGFVALATGVALYLMVGRKMIEGDDL